LLPRDSEMIARWRLAAQDADLHTQHARRGTRPAYQTAEPSL
jgi:hypothetical protein